MERLGPSEIKTDYSRQYDELLIGECMKLPLSMIKPIIVDDCTESHTDGPIEVFKNHSGLIYIDDGNHRYFNYVNKLYIENGYKKPDFDNYFMLVKKVYPVNTWML